MSEKKSGIGVVIVIVLVVFFVFPLVLSHPILLAPVVILGGLLYHTFKGK